MKDHYAVLGVSHSATAEEIRSAWREKARRWHPDRGDESTVPLFIEAKEAYDVLGDGERRHSFDTAWELFQAAKRTQTSRVKVASRTPADSARSTTAEPKPTKEEAAKKQFFEIRQKLVAMEQALARSQYAEAATLAQAILDKDFRQPKAHAVLGDLARIQGLAETAQLHYAYALQADPTNEVYFNKHEEMMHAVARGGFKPRDPGELKPGPTLAALFVIALCAAYSVSAPQQPLLPWSPVFGTWTGAQVLMATVAGFATGVGLALGGVTGKIRDQFGTIVVQTPPIVPALALGVLNSWAGLLYCVLVVRRQKASSTEIEWFFGGITTALVVFALIMWIDSRAAMLQMLAWGGSLMVIGGVVGWLVMDVSRPNS